MIIKKSVLKILFFTILLALSACSNKKFKLIDKEEKTTFLSSKPVFDSRVLAEMSGTISETPSHSSSSSTGTVSEGGSANGANTSAGSGNIGTGIGGTNTGTGGGSIGTGIGGINTGFGGGSIGTGSSNNIIVNPNPTQAIGTGANSIPFNFICSYRRTTNNQGNVKESTKPLTIVFTDQNTNNELCRMTSSNIKDTLLNERRLLIPDSCNKLTPNSKISVTLFESPNQNFIYSSYEKDTVKYYGNLDGIWLQNGVPHLYVLLDRNIDNFEKPEGIDPCDKRSSPLFVDLGTNETLALSPPSKGIFFNIL